MAGAMIGRLRLDPTVCTAYGLCPDWLPERIELDEWGYPNIDPTPLTSDLVRHARRAAQACPVRALELARLVSRPGVADRQTP